MLLHDPLADVRRHFDHAGDLPLLIQHRHIAGFKPDLTPCLVDPLEGAADSLSLPQFAPELLVFGCLYVGRVAEQPMMLAA
ncbi:hypothetical protein D3C78_1735860 [compost metagenome]